MAYRSLLLFFAGTAMFGSTITTSLIVRENAAPSRRAYLSIGDGASSVLIDLFRSTAAMEPAVKQIGFCNTYGVSVTTCDFTPGGAITAVDLNIPTSGMAADAIVLNGVEIPASQFSDYRLSFTVKFYGSSPVHGTELVEWGPVPVQGDTFVALTSISRNVCVFCAESVNGSGTASGLSYSGDFGYGDYRFRYAVAGSEASPEPGTFVLIAAGAFFCVMMRLRRPVFSRAILPRKLQPDCWRADGRKAARTSDRF